MSQEPPTAGSLLRDARRRAGLSQGELARRAGVAQSVVSVYESGHREASLPTIARLVAATGYELHFELREPEEALDQLTGPLGQRVRACRKLLRDHLAHRHFDTIRAVVEATVTEDLPELEGAVHRMLARSRVRRTVREAVVQFAV
ncbi:MAG TPA: helix-turn-helix transcriptional regulator [Candidatus Dormibacteraeota bacterium]|nr:helix-turn-helix transcriptional regulator [Candidatus Dormibacteraeota bacterium]